MRRLIWLVLLVTTALPGGPAVAQETDALRRELEQLRRELERTREEYRRTIDAMSERLRRLEAQPPPGTTTGPAPAAPTSPAPPLPPAGTTQAPPAPSPTLGPAELLRPRPPFALADRRGAAQLLFDIGVSADFIANLTQRNVDQANAGSFPGRENRLFPREIELNLFGQVDPYAAGVVRIEAGEEEPGEQAAVSLAEAYFTLLTLPGGTQLRVGQLRNRFGLLNEFHRDGLPQPDVPNVLLRFLGEEGLRERGAELTWVPPLPFYLEALVGVFNGDNDTAFGRGKLSEPLLTGRLRTFFEPTETSAIQVGVSGAHGRTAERRSSNLAGFDVKYKYRPEGWLHPLLTLAAEGLYSIRRTAVGEDLDGDGVADVESKRTRRRFGWYGYAELQPWRRWAFGARYDATQYPLDPGREWALEPYLTFFPSEFLRFRLAYKHTERSSSEAFAAAGGSARVADEVFLQGTFILGAHPAHPF